MNESEKSETENLELLQQRLMRVEGVQAVGQTVDDGKHCLKVYFVDETSLKTAEIPSEEFGILIVKAVSGSIQSQ